MLNNLPVLAEDFGYVFIGVAHGVVWDIRGGGGIDVADEFAVEPDSFGLLRGVEPDKKTIFHSF
jgi:hypothetical protein